VFSLEVGFSSRDKAEIFLLNLAVLMSLMFSLVCHFIMNRLTEEQRLQIVQIYFENNGSARGVYRKLRTFNRQHNCLSEQLIRLTLDCFRSTFTLCDNTHRQKKQLPL